MKRLCLLALLLCLLTVPAFGASPDLEFCLSAEGQTSVRAAPGDVLTVTLEVEADKAYSMLAMQDEILYDKTFFRLVENSDLPGEGIRANDIALRDHRRAHYLNFVSLTGGQTWQEQTLVGTFQLEVIANTGSSSIENTNCRAAGTKNQYTVTVCDLTVTVSDRCEVRFDSMEGSAVSPQTLQVGQLLNKPADPVRKGFAFTGWYRDIDCLIPWDFSADRVEHNTHLYAGWKKQQWQYEDVLPENWFFGDVEYVSGKGLMSGVGGGRFAPQSATNRAMIVTILWRLEGQPAAGSANPFLDVADGQWYTEPIRWAAEKGIVNGYSADRFGPVDKITREQMATILYRYAAYKGYDVSARADLTVFADGKTVSTWAAESLSWANAKGLINGLPGSLLAPGSNAVRCQTAAILHRFCEKIA